MSFAYVGPVPPIRGGIAQHAAALLAALEAAGNEVNISSWRSQYPALLYPGGPDRDRAAEPAEEALFTMAWWDPTSWWRAGRRASRSDVLLFPWVTPLQAPVHRTVLSASRPATSVVLVHNPLPHERRRLDQGLSRWVLRRVDAALVHSSPAARDVVALAPGIRIGVAPLPPQLPVAPAPLPPSPPHRLLFFGLVRRYKGLDIAMEALRMLVAQGVDVELTVAGDFWVPVDEWHRRIARSGLERRVHLRPGYVPDRDVSELLAAHHVVVAPYRTATQSGIVPIANAAGRPVVASRVGGLAEQITDGVNGVLVPAEDPGRLAEGILTAVRRLDDLSASARSSSASWPDVVDALLELIR